MKFSDRQKGWIINAFAATFAGGHLLPRPLISVIAAALMLAAIFHFVRNKG